MVLMRPFRPGRRPKWIAFATVFALLPASAAAQDLHTDPILALWSFDEGDEGWRLVGNGDRTLPEHRQDAETGNGYIVGKDSAAYVTWYWQAPPIDQDVLAAVAGGALQYRLRQDYTDAQFDAPDVLLSGAGMTLGFDADPNPGSDWTDYRVPFQAEGWTHEADGTPASDEDLSAVLGDLETLQIRGEYRVGNDDAGLDEVTILGPVETEDNATPPAAGEPNDTPATAEAITFGEIFEFTLTPRLDRDVFAMTADADGTITIEWIAVPGEHRGLHSRWLDADSTALRDGEWDFGIAAGETVFLELRSNYFDSGSNESDTPILLTAEFEPEPFDDEPNGTPDTARAVALGEPFAFALTPRLDRDVFALTSDRAGTVTIERTDVPEEHAGLHPRWLSGEGAVLRNGEWDYGMDAGETVFLELRSNYFDSSGQASATPVVLTPIFTPEPFDDEPNGTPETARPTSFGEPFAFALTPRLDRDVFAITSDTGGTVTVERTDVPAEHAGLHPRWLSADSTVRRDGEWDYGIGAGETVFLELRSNYFDSSGRASATPIVLTTAFEPAPFDHEPNNTAETALPVPFGEPFAFALTPRLDRDVFRLTPPAPGILEIERLQVPETHSGLHPRWLATDGAVLRDGEWDFGSTDAAPVFLELRSNYWDSGARASSEIVELLVRFTPQPDGWEPDGTIATARPGRFGEPITIHLTPRHDRDVIAFLPTEDGTVRVRVVDGADVHVGPHPRWLAADGTVLRDGDWDVATIAGVPVFLELRSAYWNAQERASPEPVTVAVEALGGRDAFEPNDTIDLASSPPLAEPFDVTFTPIGDLDVFRFEPAVDSRLTITLLPDEGESPEPYARLLDAEGTGLQEGLGPFWLPAGGPYFVQLRGAYWRSNETGSSSPIGVRFDITPANDRFEPNDAEPVALAVGQTVEGRVDDGDVDRFGITVPADGVYRLDLSPVPGDSGLAVTVTGDGGEALPADEDLVLAEGDAVSIALSGDAGDYQVALVRVSLDPRATASRYPTRPPRLTPAPSLFDTN